MFYLTPHPYVCSLQEKKISSKLPKTEVTPRPRVRELALVRVPFDPADDAEALIDGLLWSCQPMQVRVQMSHDNDYENNFIKVTLLIRRSISKSIYIYAVFNFL